jgi:hypothetical protein
MRKAILNCRIVPKDKAGVGKRTETVETTTLAHMRIFGTESHELASLRCIPKNASFEGNPRTLLTAEIF